MMWIQVSEQRVVIYTANMGFVRTSRSPPPTFSQQDTKILGIRAYGDQLCEEGRRMI